MFRAQVHAVLFLTVTSLWIKDWLQIPTKAA